MRHRCLPVGRQARGMRRSSTLDRAHTGADFRFTTSDFSPPPRLMAESGKQIAALEWSLVALLIVRAGWCRPAELNRVRLGFSEACDRHTRAAWMGHQDSNLESPDPESGVLPVTPCPSGAPDGTRTRYGRRDKPVPRRLWLRRPENRLALPKLQQKPQGRNKAKAGRGGIAPPTSDLETDVMLISPTA